MLRVESPALSVDLLPDVGGKVAQIREKNTGIDILVPAQRPYRTIAPDGDWLQGDTSGMDDCFPNIAAGRYPDPPWEAAMLPDLGEWTHGSWEVLESASDRVVLARPGIALPYLVHKSIRFTDERTLEFSYRVENPSDSPLRYMWSAHPLIAVPGEFHLRLPPGNLRFRTFPPDGREHQWPHYDAVDLSSQWIAEGTNLKLFITGLSAGWCELRLPQHTLTFSFDSESTPVVGVWFNNFGFPQDGTAKFRCIAVEPCTSPSDLLDDLPAGSYRCLGPRAIAKWSLRLTIAANR